MTATTGYAQVLTRAEEERRAFVHSQVGQTIGKRMAVVTLFRGSVAVAASACWPGDGTQEARRLTEALGHNRHKFYDHIKVREFDTVVGYDGIQLYAEPRKVKRYGHR